MRRTLLGTSLFVAVVTPGLRPPLAGAADPPAPLKLVPADAAVFFHADVERIWKSKVGETFRKVNAKDISQGLAFLKDTAGITPDDVSTFTFFVPKLKQDGRPPFGMIVNTKKPYDRDKIVAYLKKQVEREQEKVEEQPGNKYVIGKAVTFDLGDPRSFRAYFQYEPKADPAGDGPLAPAIKAAADGKPAVLGVAFGNLPDEIRQENVPAEIRPFQPFFFSDSGILTADFVKDELVLDVKFKNPTRAKAVEAEKSLGALKTLIVTGLDFGIKELSKDKDLGTARFVQFLTQVQAAVRAARITNEENTPGTTLTAKADIDFAALLEYAFGKVGRAGDRMMEQNNLKQIGLAMHNYHDVYQAFPPAAVVGRKGKPLLSWRVTILPYVGHNDLYKKFKLDEPWDSAHNKKVLDDNPMPRVFLAPGAAAKADEKKTHYQVFVGNGAAFDLIEGTKIFGFTDGTSNTLLVATAKTPVTWTKPDDLEFDPKKDPRDLLLFVNDVCNVAFADGSVRAMTKKAPEETWKAVITKAGGEVVELP